VNPAQENLIVHRLVVARVRLLEAPTAEASAEQLELLAIEEFAAGLTGLEDEDKWSELDLRAALKVAQLYNDQPADAG
jgi:hypothetical protein